MVRMTRTLDDHQEVIKSLKQVKKITIDVSLTKVKEIAIDYGNSIASCHSIFLGKKGVAVKHIAKLLKCEEIEPRNFVEEENNKP